MNADTKHVEKNFKNRATPFWNWMPINMIKKLWNFRINLLPSSSRGGGGKYDIYTDETALLWDETSRIWWDPDIPSQSRNFYKSVLFVVTIQIAKNLSQISRLFGPEYN
jgi:hypothetical protein